MSIALVRVDDRLIHGQVVIGWVQALGIRHIVLVDDRVCGNAWEQEIYRLGVPDDIEVEFVSVDEGSRRVHAWNEDAAPTILLLGDVETAGNLCDRCPDITRVNLGGVHDGTGREQYLPYVYLSTSETERLRKLHDAGIEITAQAVPTDAPVSLEKLLG